MHIAEGVLTGPVLISGAVAAAACTAAGLRRLDPERLPMVGLLGAAFFAASLIHVPMGPTSVHLVLNGMVGLLLGWAAFPAILTALLLQAVFFQMGGITTLGVNTMIMALPAVAVYYLFAPFLWKSRRIASAAAFGCGFFSVLLSACLFAAALVFTEKNFFAMASAAAAANIPVMTIEGAVTAFCILFLKKVQPSLLPGFSAEKTKQRKRI